MKPNYKINNKFHKFKKIWKNYQNNMKKVKHK